MPGLCILHSPGIFMPFCLFAMHLVPPPSHCYTQDTYNNTVLTKQGVFQNGKNEKINFTGMGYWRLVIPVVCLALAFISFPIASAIM